jgi:hypothetical protein
VARYGFDERRPDEVSALRREPAADLAAAMLAEMALEDATGAVRLSGLDPRRQREWIESVASRGPALRDAQGLLLSALRSRPGWSYLRYLLGRVELAAAPVSDAQGSDRLWATLRSAAQALPGLDSAWVALGAASLERWPRLTGEERGLGERAIRRAFADAEFVRASLRTALRTLGRDRALELLPEDPAPLQAALDCFEEDRDTDSYAQIALRWRAADRGARTRSLAAIEERARVGDLSAVADACRVWAESHRPWTLDDAQARRQALRVLELWPRLSPGSWDSDHRGELIRFFLNGREDSVEGRALANAMEPLSGVPDPIRARVYLLSGDEYALDALLRSSPSVGGFDWTGTFAAIARREAAAGRLAGAREALARIPEAARGACDVLLARRAVAAASGDRREIDEVELRLAAEAAEVFEPEAWSPSRGLLLCLDPEANRSRALQVRLTAAAPAYVEWGWNGVRAGGALVPPGAGVLQLPLEGREGRVTVHLRDRVGGPTRVERTTVGESR